MQRKDFIKHSSLLSGAFALAGSSIINNIKSENIFAPGVPWFNKSVRWAQLAFVETDPGSYDPDFWLGYFKKIHAQGALLSAGGVVAFYPTDLPLHHRSNTLGNSNP